MAVLRRGRGSRPAAVVGRPSRPGPVRGGCAAVPPPLSGARPAALAVLLPTLAAAAAGCASLDPLPARPEPIAYVDTLPIHEPEEREPAFVRRVVDEAVADEAAEAIDVRRWAGRGREALNLTHDDEVVGSAWFQHRNGRASMTPAQVRAGAASAPPPDVDRPLTVVAGKADGIQPGFTVLDARGDRYLLKFDPPGSLRLASSADIVTSRLLHAAGYNVPADYAIAFDSARLVVAPGAEIEVEGRERPMTREDVARVLERTEPLPDGRWLALASRFVPGTPKGPFLFEGRREDDPNDHYLHQYRRELRGLYVLCAWLNHVDMRYENTLDTFIDPPGYLRHYLIDFASSLGSGGIRPHLPREGREHNFDLWPTLARVFTLGFYRVGWEDETGGTIHPAVGWLPVETFRPGEWKPNWPNAAFRRMTEADGYWGAKLVGSFTDEQIRAAVSAAPRPPAAADTLVRILALRRDSTVAHWFGRVTPVEAPRATPSGGGAGFVLEFEDAGLARGMWAARAVRYRWELRGPEGEPRWRGVAGARPAGRQRLRVGPAAEEAGTRSGADTGSDADGPPAAGVEAEAEAAAETEVAGNAGAALLELRLRALRRDGPDGREAIVWLRPDGAGGYGVVGHRH